MKRSYYLLVITQFLLFAILLWGCGGGGPGAPGSGGTEDTGVETRIIDVSHVDPTGDRGDSWQLDLSQTDCKGEPETWGDDYADISFFGVPIYDEATENVLYITNYRVTFYQLDPTIPPIDEIQAGVQGVYTIIPNTVSNPYRFLVLDSGRKTEVYYDIIYGSYNPSRFPLEYNMVIEMWGKDKYNNDFTIGPVIRHILLADYNNC